jgi:O-antigen biosynthesis protein WbqP
MKRSIDFLVALVLLFMLSLPMLLISLFIKLTSEGGVVYWSDRIGRENKIFKMAKFRTMNINTPALATHLLKNPDIYVTRVGRFLRKYSLDELPQLVNIILGDMGFIGPRPALFNQHDLIELRTRNDIHKLTPGVTGWAQINGRDELPIPVKVEFDKYYLKNRSFLLDIKILFITLIKVINKEGVSH